MEKYKKMGRMIIQDKKQLFYIQRVEQKNSIHDMTPCECDAMAYFILDALNNGDFEKYYNEYMKK